jgi:ADP-ribosylglycohydrolase
MTLPADHDERMQRARLALDGLSVGDAFGNCLGTPEEWVPWLASGTPPRNPPAPPWPYTDDTKMAIGIVEVLQRHGRIDQDELATVFARRFRADPNRGYGPGTMGVLRPSAKECPGGRQRCFLSVVRRGCWPGCCGESSRASLGSPGNGVTFTGRG